MPSTATEPARGGLRHLWWGSLPLRVLISTLGASLVVLLLAGVLLIQQAQDGIVEQKKQGSLTEAASAFAFMQQQLRLPEARNVAVYEQLSRLAEQGGQAGQYGVVIQGPSSQLVSAGISAESVPEALTREVSGSDAMFITPTQVVFDTGEPDVPGWAVGTVLVDSAGERYPVYYIFPMTSELATLRALQGAVVTTGVALLVALAAIAYLVTMQVVRPVRRASQTALRLASGNLDERMEVRGTDDIARLAESMNEMAGELRQRILELESLSMVQRRFVSDVSHELRTPMTTIKMASDLLNEERDRFDPADARAVELMGTEIERFDSLLADLLEISRFDAGAAVLELDEVDLDALVASEVDAQASFAESQHTVLRLRRAEGATAMMDARRIRRVVRNLLTNAIEHGEGRPVDVTVGADEDAVAVTVRDHGVGFQPDQSTQVFERFWRADPSRTRVVGGSGLGLAIAKEDVNLHQGWLTAWGRPGKGAQFRLTLPRQPDRVLMSSPLPVTPVDLFRRVGP